MILRLSTSAVIDVVNDSVFYQTAGEGQALALRFCDYHAAAAFMPASPPIAPSPYGSVTTTDASETGMQAALPCSSGSVLLSDASRISLQ